MENYKHEANEKRRTLKKSLSWIIFGESHVEWSFCEVKSRSEDNQTADKFCKRNFNMRGISTDKNKVYSINTGFLLGFAFEHARLSDVKRINQSALKIAFEKLPEHHYFSRKNVKHDVIGRERFLSECFFRGFEYWSSNSKRKKKQSWKRSITSC